MFIFAMIAACCNCEKMRMDIKCEEIIQNCCNTTLRTVVDMHVNEFKRNALANFMEHISLRKCALNVRIPIFQE